MAEAANETGLVAAIVKAIKRDYPTAYIVKIHGGPYQMPGIPDLLGCVDGLMIGIEVKHQKVGESEAHARARTTPAQKVQIARINAAGGMAGTAITVGEALDIVRRAYVKQAAIAAGREGTGDSE